MDLHTFHAAFAHGHSVRLAEHPRLVEAMRRVLDVMPTLLPIRGPYIDYDADRQDAEIRKVVDILQANQLARASAAGVSPGREPTVRALQAKAQIKGALDGYLAAVTALVLEGNLNVDQGEELMRIVDKIVEET